MRSVNEYKRAVSITEKADDHLSNIIESRDAKAIMLSVKGGGCAGFTYEWDVMDSIEWDAYDAIPLTNGYLCISPTATLFITNTTIDYTLTDHAKDFGGISGALLTDKSYTLFRAIGKELYDKTLLISVGGIDSAEEAYKRIKAGASLVQIYSMLVYRGPALIKEINEGLIVLLKKDGYTHISEAIGADWK